MNAERCAVPNCNNTATTGIPFPKQSKLLEKWLKSLEMLDFVPSSNSFICLRHFGNGDIVDRVTDSELENVVEDLPIPVKTQKNETRTGTSIKYETQCEEDVTQSMICRLCMGGDVNKNIFDTIEDDIKVVNLITCCIPQIEISENDTLSEWICKKCFEMLQLFYNFQETCIKMDQKQKEFYSKTSTKRKIAQEFNVAPKKICLNSDNCVVASTSTGSNRSELDKRFDEVEAELMRTIEGKLPEEMRSADNIIFEVRSDEENEQCSDVAAILSEDNVLRVGSDEVRLPKGIKISVNQNHTKVCDVQNVKAKQTDFCLVDNYLFEYRLIKGNIRYLRCLVPRCKATAQQSVIKSGVFENKVLVKSSHNHPVPSEDERNKQIFLHLMRRRMQSDKTLNFRNVYDEFCAKDPEIKRLVPLKTVINQICCQQMNMKSPPIYSFEQFFTSIEGDNFQKLHFTHSNAQFYQEKFEGADGSKAIIFANKETIERISDSKIMYVDASFKIDTLERFRYHLVSVLVWVTDSYYPIMFALINEKSQDIYKLIFYYLHDSLAPKLRPREIVTDYEASLYYSLGEVYLDSHIGGSVFYYTQNLYKKICSLNLSRELETNSCFRNIYHMILMLPLLPVNTILDGLTNIELQAHEMGQNELAAPIFEYVKSEWIAKVTPDLFCVHRLENRINENVIAPFKKLRDFIMLSKGKMQKQQINIASVVEKLIELEGFLSVVYSAPSKKSFARDLSSSQKKNVIRAWQFIESHPKININNFFTKVLGYIKCMENQLWIWGFYRYTGAADDDLINAENFSIVNSNDEDHNYDHHYVNYVYPEGQVVVDVMIDEKDGFLVKEGVAVPEQEEMEEEERNSFQTSYME